ncbi:unnamed protein product [Lampetra fluviatilis]
MNVRHGSGKAAAPQPRSHKDPPSSDGALTELCREESGHFALRKQGRPRHPCGGVRGDSHFSPPFFLGCSRTGGVGGGGPCWSQGPPRTYFCCCCSCCCCCPCCCSSQPRCIPGGSHAEAPHDGRALVMEAGGGAGGGGG